MKGLQDWSIEGVSAALREIWQAMDAQKATSTKTATQVAQLHRTLGLGAGGNRLTVLDDLSETVERQRQESAAESAAATDAANAAYATILRITDDNVLSSLEKPEIIASMAQVLAEEIDLVAQAMTYSIKAERTDYETAVANLVAFLNGLIPAWNDTALDSPLGAGGGLILANDMQEVTRTRDLLKARIVTGIAVAQSTTITHLAASFSDSAIVFRWDPVDLLGIAYEVRLGRTWETAQIVGRPVNALFETSSDGTYWVASRYGTTYGIPSSLAVTGSANLKRNMVATFDEFSMAWPGTRSAAIKVTADGWLTLDTAVGLTGRYESTNVVDLGAGNTTLCGVLATLGLAVGSLTDTLDTWPDFDTRTSIDGKYGLHCRTTVEIALAQSDGTFGDWIPYAPGRYLGRKFKMALALSTDDANAVPYVTAFNWSVDAPDRFESKTGVACPTTGLTVTFSKAFLATPVTSIAIANALQNDYFVLSGETAAGFTVRCYNAGTAVARTISHFSKGC